MPDQYGSTSLPVPVPEHGTSAADPLLDTLLDYFSTVIQAECGDAWDSISGNIGGQPLVKKVFAHNPTPQAFRANGTPALYLWRQSSQPATWRAWGYRIRPSKLILRWVPFMANSQDRARIWEPFFNAIPSALDVAVERGRHKSWIKADDADANAAFLGSWLYSYAKVWQLRVGMEDIQRSSVTIAMEGAGATQEYPALDIPFLLEEKLTEDVSSLDEIAYTQSSLTTPPSPPDLTQPLVITTGRFDFDPGD